MKKKSLLCALAATLLGALSLASCGESESSSEATEEESSSEATEEESSSEATEEESSSETSSPETSSPETSSPEEEKEAIDVSQHTYAATFAYADSDGNAVTNHDFALGVSYTVTVTVNVDETAMEADDLTYYVYGEMTGCYNLWIYANDSTSVTVSTPEGTNGNSLTATFTVNAAGVYSLTAQLKANDSDIALEETDDSLLGLYNSQEIEMTAEIFYSIMSNTEVGWESSTLVYVTGTVNQVTYYNDSYGSWTMTLTAGENGETITVYSVPFDESVVYFPYTDVDSANAALAGKIIHVRAYPQNYNGTYELAWGDDDAIYEIDDWLTIYDASLTATSEALTLEGSASSEDGSVSWSASTTLTASLSVDGVTSTEATYSYAITDSEGTTVESGASVSEGVFTATVSGTYLVTATATLDGSEVAESEAVTITVSDAYYASLSVTDEGDVTWGRKASYEPSFAYSGGELPEEYQVLYRTYADSSLETVTGYTTINVGGENSESTDGSISITYTSAGTYYVTATLIIDGEEVITSDSVSFDYTINNAPTIGAEISLGSSSITLIDATTDENSAGTYAGSTGIEVAVTADGVETTEAAISYAFADSENNSVSSLSVNDGVLTATEAGSFTVTVTATYDGGTGTATADITVNAYPSASGIVSVATDADGLQIDSVDIYEPIYVETVALDSDGTAVTPDSDNGPWIWVDASSSVATAYVDDQDSGRSSSYVVPVTSGSLTISSSYGTESDGIAASLSLTVNDASVEGSVLVESGSYTGENGYIFSYGLTTYGNVIGLTASCASSDGTAYTPDGSTYLSSFWAACSDGDGNSSWPDVSCYADDNAATVAYFVITSAGTWTFYFAVYVYDSSWTEIDTLSVSVTATAGESGYDFSIPSSGA